MEYTCGNCGGMIEDVSAGKCPHCSVEFEAVERPIPWEERATLGFFNAFTASWLLSLTRPTEYFRRMPISGGYSGPLLYAFILGIAGAWFSLAWQIALSFLTDIDRSGEMTPETAVSFNLVIAAITPIILPIGLFLGSGLTHLFLIIVGGARSGFEATFRVVCYSSAPAVFTIIPFCGSIVGGIWSLVLEVIGLRDAHGITTRRAVLALLLPLFFICGLVMIFIALGLPPGTEFPE